MMIPWLKPEAGRTPSLSWTLRWSLTAHVLLPLLVVVAGWVRLWLFPPAPVPKANLEFVLLQPGPESEPKTTTPLRSEKSSAGGGAQDRPEPPKSAPKPPAPAQATPKMDATRPPQPEPPPGLVPDAAREPAPAREAPPPLEPEALLPESDEDSLPMLTAALSDLESDLPSDTSGESAQPSKQSGPAAQANPLAPFLVDLKQRLAKNWHPPRGDASRRVTLRFEIDRLGQVLAVDIAEPSGEKRLDTAAVETVWRSGPFQPLPQGYPAERVPILFTFDYTVYGLPGQRRTR